MSAVPTAPATMAAARAALWAQLRLVVIDVETTAADDGLHVIEVAAVICRDGRRTSRTWTVRVNPGVPVDARSHTIHGITDDDLVDEPPFAAIVAELTRRLRGLDGEAVVLVAHNVGFDVGVLRREFTRLGLEFPDLPVLDTKPLSRHVGTRPASGRLPDLAATLGVPHLDAHTAAGDAEAAADIVIALLERACLAGWRDFGALHAVVMGARARTSSIRASAARRVVPEDSEPGLGVDLPNEHTAAHGTLLTDDSPDSLAAWVQQLTDCAWLRCPYAEDRVATAAIDPARRREAVESVLDRLLTTGHDGPDVSAVATILGALTPLLAELPSRDAALRWHDRWQPRLAAVGRCDRSARDAVACPACRAGQPCPLDVWQRHLATAARGTVTAQSAKSFLHVTGVNSGRGVLTTWLAAKRRLLAEATAWLVYREHRDAGQAATADMFARHAHRTGARDPRLVAAYANLLAAPGDQAALQRAIDVCDDAFLSRQGSTDDAWTELAAKRGQLLGRLSRVRGHDTGQLDDDGNPIPVRRHHPDVPRRRHARRFALG